MRFSLLYRNLSANLHKNPKQMKLKLQKIKESDTSQLLLLTVQITFNIRRCIHLITSWMISWGIRLHSCNFYKPQGRQVLKTHQNILILLHAVCCYMLILYLVVLWLFSCIFCVIGLHTTTNHFYCFVIRLLFFFAIDKKNSRIL